MFNSQIVSSTNNYLSSSSPPFSSAAVSAITRDSNCSSSSSSASSNCSLPRNCAICSGPSNGVYFGVLSCAACASFFRRSALEKRQYVCRRANNCAIHADGMRNSCRACRLRRCTQAGMCMDNASSYQTGRMQRIQRTTAGTPAAATLTAMSAAAAPLLQDQQTTFIGAAAPNLMPSNFSINATGDNPLSNNIVPNIQHFAHSLKTLHTGYQAIGHVVSDQPRNFTNPNEVQLITKEEFLQIQRGEVALILAFVREHFPQLDNLPYETKVQILKYFSARFGFMIRAEMTIKAFPDQNIEQMRFIMLHPGRVMDRNNLEFFFANVQSPTEHIRQCNPIMDKMGNIYYGRYKPMNVCPTEFAALVGLQLWNSVERHVSSSEEVITKRNHIYAELHTFLAHKIGGNPFDFAAIAIRFGQLLGLLHLIDVHSWEMEEVFMMIRIFLSSPCPGEIWDNLLASEQQQQNMENTTDTIIDVEQTTSFSIGADDEQQQQQTPQEVTAPKS